MSNNEQLTEEQRARIEQNRAKALALRLQQQQQQQQKRTLETDLRPASGSSKNEGFTAILNRPSSSSLVGNSYALKTPEKGERQHARTNLTSKYWYNKGAGNSSSSGSPSGNGVSPTKKTVAKCVLTTNYRFCVLCGYQKEVIDLFKTVQGAVYRATTKTWSFPLSSYRDFERKMTQFANVSLEKLPPHIIFAFEKYISGAAPSSSKPPEYDLSHVDESLRTRLFPFQLECINFAISRNGRVLIADDMGLGKTVEALGIMSYYRDDWPALIVCPASLRHTWKHAITEWLPSVKKETIAVIDGSVDFPAITERSTLIAITSYASAVLTDEQYAVAIERKFKVVVLDESHFIKNPETKRTRSCQRITKHSKRLILLSGTPALSRPKELYTQVDAVCPKLFRSFTSFGERYCNPTQVLAKGGRMVTDYGGNSNMEELEVLLKETIMLRRVKEDVLSQLPPKTRGIVLLDSRLVKVDKKIAERARRNLQDASVAQSKKRSEMLEFFNATAEAKLKAATEYICDLLENNKKFLVFAHHRVMLDHLHSKIVQKKIDVIRIDGSTPPAERNALCDRFQTSDSVRVALLSITASGIGLTLTAANLVVFAELFWNPGILAQAEDRAHRVGQVDSVQIQYLVAEGTADDFIWPLVQKKLAILNKGGLSKGAFQTSETKRLETADADASDEQMSQQLITEFVESLSEDTPASVEDPGNTTTQSKRRRVE